MNKFTMLIMLFMSISFSQVNTVYHNGTDCNCDSINQLYDDNGKVFHETPYVNGKKNGIDKGYKKSGQLSSEALYLNGKIQGDRKFYAYEYYESGTLWRKYSDDDSNTGIRYAYYSSGELMCETPYKREQGCVSIDINCIYNVTPNGIRRCWYRSGELSSELNYVNGKENGIEKRYNKKGMIIEESMYVNGYERCSISGGQEKTNGLKKDCYKNGILKRITNYRHGKIHGIMKEYLEDGSLKMETPYVNGERSGIEKWYVNGKLVGAAKYKNGILDGYKHCSDGRIGNEQLDCF
jgi:antitoxin component YwqK of YwqJK toxin-antitoxin module